MKRFDITIVPLPNKYGCEYHVVDMHGIHKPRVECTMKRARRLADRLNFVYEQYTDVINETEAENHEKH